MVDVNSILNSVKKLLNIDDEDTAFDTDVMMLINGEFMTLHQLGIGPEKGYSITGPSNTWSEFTDDSWLQPSVKNYVFMKVRMIFDPPASSVVADAYNSRISELEWRMLHQAEYKQTIEEYEESKKEKGGADM